MKNLLGDLMKQAEDLKTKAEKIQGHHVQIMGIVRLRSSLPQQSECRECAQGRATCKDLQHTRSHAQCESLALQAVLQYSGKRWYAGTASHSSTSFAAALLTA